MSKNAVDTVNRPVSRQEMTRRQWIWKEMKRNKVAYLMAGPFMVLFFIFTILPVALSVFFSLTDFNMLQTPNWVGLTNYVRLFTKDEIFLKCCKNTLIFYAPSISGNVYLIWGTLFSGDSYGWVNAWGMKLGLLDAPVLWFQTEEYVMPLCIIVALWTSLGTSFLAFIAGLQGVDRSLFEAGAVDGIKNRWQELWYITLPSMRPQLMFGAVLSITSSFGFGGVVDALCGNPSVNYAGHTIMHHLGDYGGTRFEVGYSSAIAVILFIIMISCNAVIKKALSKVGQ
ncbi:MAG: sugar ABC transporter permease [Clostridia bacterium]|nr:sugar ABC transporter permease [Clostridia bacterium]